MSIESGHDPKMWIDASTAQPALVAWQYHEAVAWVYEQLVEHRRQAADDHHERLDGLIDSYVPAAVGPDADHYRDVDATHPPSLWQRLPQTLQAGDWAMEPFQIGPGRKLVLQILGYADGGQPASAAHGRRNYQVCGTHARPEDKPYLGLTGRQTEHFTRYERVYLSS